MIEILLVLSFIIMARRRKRQYRRKGGSRGRKLVYLPISATLALSTLLDNIVIKGTTQAVFSRRFHVVYTKLFWTLRSATAGEGPIICGLAHSDYSVLEIAEAQDVAVVNSSNKVEQERANRWVREIGSFRGLTTEEEIRGNSGGEKVYSKLNWTIEEAMSLDFWCQNRTGGTLAGGAILEIEGDLVGYWQ